jgi:hypothetical protein
MQLFIARWMVTQPIHACGQGIDDAIQDITPSPLETRILEQGSCD